MLALALSPVLLVLLASTESGYCFTPCPAQCVNSFAMLEPTNGRIKWIRGQDASSVIRLFKVVSSTSGSSTSVVTLRINGRDVPVPSNAKPMIIEVLKRHPEMSHVIFELLQKRQPSFPGEPMPSGAGKIVEEPEIVTAVPSGSEPSVPYGPSRPSNEVPFFPGVPDVRRRPDEPVMPYEPVVPGFPDSGKPYRKPSRKPSGHEPSVPYEPFVPSNQVPFFPGVPDVPRRPDEPVMPYEPVVPGFQDSRKPSSEGLVPNPLHPTRDFPFEPRFVPEDIRSYLEMLVRNPDYFVPIYKILVRKGVRFPDVSRPFTYVTINGRRVDLPSKVTVVFTVRINGQQFVLPRDGQRLVSFISRHPDQMPTIATILQQFGAVVTTSTGGKVTGFTLFGKPYVLPNPVSTRVIVNGRTFNLPRDIPDLIGAIQSNPQEFHRILPVLESFGVRPQKSPTGEISMVVINGRTFPVRSVAPARIVIHGRPYTIPADLDVLLNQPDNLVVGELISALQKLKIPVTVDKDTGNVAGIVMDGVPIPFPTTVRLRVKLGGRVYRIPRDLPSIVTYLEQNRMPSTILSHLYTNYGVIPVRNANNVVVALSFNNKKYPVRVPQSQTIVVISGSRFVLPKDTNTLVRSLNERRIQVEEFLRVVQEAGYKLIPDADGVLRTIQKGFDVISLPSQIRLIVNINGVRYRVPKDLPRVVQTLGNIKNLGSIEPILVSLRNMGVRVQRTSTQVTLVFNKQSYSFPISPGARGGNYVVPGAPTDTVAARINFNGQWFTLPTELEAMMSVVRSNGPMAIQLLIKTLRSHGITVNLTPSGADIVSIVIHGQVYTVSGGRAPPSSGGSGGASVVVTIRGRQFTIPRDIGILPRTLPGFQYGELILALHRAGALLEVDEKGNFYGMRIQGRVTKFSVIFRVNVMLSRGGRAYRVPLDLAELAQGLSSAGHRWNWASVRKVLRNSGVEIQGGTAGAPRAIGFQGKFYELRGSGGAVPFGQDVQMNA